MNSNTFLIYVKRSLFTLRLLKFSLVGGSGVLVNMFCLYLLTELFQIFYIISSIVAIETSILSNFFLNSIWTWNDRKQQSSFNRLLKYHICVGITAIIANWLLLISLTELAGLHYLLSNLIGICIGVLINFVTNDLWTFYPCKSKNKQIKL